MAGAGEFEDRDARAARTFLVAAERAGVARIVYLGGLGEPSADLSPHLANRQEWAGSSPRELRPRRS